MGAITDKGDKANIVIMGCACMLALALALCLTGCGDSTSTIGGTASGTSGSVSAQVQAPQIDGLEFDHAMDLDYATQFDVYYYDNGFKLIDVHSSARYLVVPEGAQAPDGLDKDIVVLQQPLDRIYLCATACMALVDAVGAIDDVKFTGTNASGWEIEAPRAALASGSMTYAGKYSAPDYETLISGNCNLALESTMILHVPEVQEMLTSLEIPVFIERSSYESEPLGRTEWVKLFGALLNREQEAEEAFNAEVGIVEALGDVEDTGKTVVFFSISSDGKVLIRQPEDYISKAIEQAGGRYAFADIETSDQSANLAITMEEFYKVASTADYLVYNGMIEDPISTVADLIAKSEVFSDFAAVKNGNVWTTDRSMYQSTDKIALMIEDFHTLVAGGGSESMTFLIKVD